MFAIVIAIAIAACSSTEENGAPGTGGANGGTAACTACGYATPGCGGDAPAETCGQGCGGAVFIAYCACDGTTLSDIGHPGVIVPKPWVHKGYCQDASSDSGLDSSADGS